jgi:hypothetical protein
MIAPLSATVLLRERYWFMDGIMAMANRYLAPEDGSVVVAQC